MHDARTTEPESYKYFNCFKITVHITGTSQSVNLFVFAVMADDKSLWTSMCLLCVICLHVVVVELAADEAWVSHAGMSMLPTDRSRTHGVRRRRQTIVNQLSAAEQQTILDAHNEYRRLEPASDMEQLVSRL